LPWGADLELATGIYFEILREVFGLRWTTPPSFLQE
jgi:hypothetical protein